MVGIHRIIQSVTVALLLVSDSYTSGLLGLGLLENSSTEPFHKSKVASMLLHRRRLSTLRLDVETASILLSLYLFVVLICLLKVVARGSSQQFD